MCGEGWGGGVVARHTYSRELTLTKVIVFLFETNFLLKYVLISIFVRIFLVIVILARNILLKNKIPHQELCIISLVL